MYQLIYFFSNRSGQDRMFPMPFAKVPLLFKRQSRSGCISATASRCSALQETKGRMCHSRRRRRFRLCIYISKTQLFLPLAIVSPSIALSRSRGYQGYPSCLEKPDDLESECNAIGQIYSRVLCQTRCVAVQSFVSTLQPCNTEMQPQALIRKLSG